MYAVDKSVPYFSEKTPKYNGSKYPLSVMCVGDSIMVPTEDERLKILVAVNDHRNSGRLSEHTIFSSKKVPGGYRIWRLA